MLLWRLLKKARGSVFSANAMIASDMIVAGGPDNNDDNPRAPLPKDGKEATVSESSRTTSTDDTKAGLGSA